MSTSSIDNSYFSILSQYSNPYSNTNIKNNSSTSGNNNTSSVAGVSSINSDGDTFQLSGLSNDTILSASEVYSRMDTDGDGSVSESEFVATRPADVTEGMAETLYSSLDTDSSGAVSESEFETAMSSATSSEESNTDNASSLQGAMAMPFQPFALLNNSANTDSGIFNSLNASSSNSNFISTTAKV